MTTQFWLFGVSKNKLELWEEVRGKPVRVEVSRRATPSVARGDFAATTLAKTMARISRQIKDPITVYLYPPKMLEEMSPGYYRRLTQQEEYQARKVLQDENLRQFARHWA